MSTNPQQYFVCLGLRGWLVGTWWTKQCALRIGLTRKPHSAWWMDWIVRDLLDNCASVCSKWSWVNCRGGTKSRVADSWWMGLGLRQNSLTHWYLLKLGKGYLKCHVRWLPSCQQAKSCWIGTQSKGNRSLYRAVASLRSHYHAQSSISVQSNTGIERRTRRCRSKGQSGPLSGRECWQSLWQSRRVHPRTKASILDPGWLKVPRLQSPRRHKNLRDGLQFSELSLVFRLCWSGPSCCRESAQGTSRWEDEADGPWLFQPREPPCLAA